MNFIFTVFALISLLLFSANDSVVLTLFLHTYTVVPPLFRPLFLTFYRLAANESLRVLNQLLDLHYPSLPDCYSWDANFQQT